MSTEVASTEAEQDNQALTNMDNTESMQFLTFIVGEEYYGIDILKVREIRGWGEPTQIPNAPEYIISWTSPCIFFHIFVYCIVLKLCNFKQIQQRTIRDMTLSLS